MSPIRFWVPGNPKGLKRHRTFRVQTKKGQIMVQSDPSENEKKDFLAIAMRHRPAEPLRDPLAVTMLCVFPRPKGHLRSNGAVKDNAPCWYASAPDVDNVMKFVGDALNGTFWHDDRQIAVANVYAVYGMAPGVAVHIRSPNDGDYSQVVFGLDEIMGSES